jgi:transcriptional regulator with XRE-family HTH domain
VEALMAIKRVTLKADIFFEELQEKFPGLTLEGIAQDLGMNPRSITNLKRGTERGDWVTQFRLAEYLSEKLGREVALKDLFFVEKGL